MILCPSDKTIKAFSQFLPAEAEAQNAELNQEQEYYDEESEPEEPEETEDNEVVAPAVELGETVETVIDTQQ